MSRLVAQVIGNKKIDYDEVFAPVAEKRKLSVAFLAFATLYGFHRSYQMDVKKCFSVRCSKLCMECTKPLEHGYVYFVNFPIASWIQEVAPIDKTLFIRRNKKDIMFCFKCLQVKQNKGGIFISQDKYVAEILKKFALVNVKAAITPMETKLPLTKDEEAFDVDVTPKTSHLNAVKRIFKYLKGKPNLGLWYPRESPLDLEAFSDSDYGGSNLDRKSTTATSQQTEADRAAAKLLGTSVVDSNQMLEYYGFITS
ncbi:hypothetical protein Tco_0547447 [Tanacetum coccineum]